MKLTREDIQKYGTEEEKKVLNEEMERYFVMFHGIGQSRWMVYSGPHSREEATQIAKEWNSKAENKHFAIQNNPTRRPYKNGLPK